MQIKGFTFRFLPMPKIMGNYFCYCYCNYHQQ